MDAPYVNIHTHARSGDGIEMVSVMAGQDVALPQSPFSIGVHPWQVGVKNAGIGVAEVLYDRASGEESRGMHLSETEVESALNEVRNVPANAIGEIGLDYAVIGGNPVRNDRAGNRDWDNMGDAVGQIKAFAAQGNILTAQKSVFEAQLRIAEERGLPVVLHCVRAFEPTMEILAKYRLPAVVFHGFVGSHEQALRAVERAGYYLSLGERSLSSPKTVEAMRVEALKRVPVESLFLETDESRLSIAEIYFRTSEIIGMPVAELAHKIYDNYMTVFGR